MQCEYRLFVSGGRHHLVDLWQLKSYLQRAPKMLKPAVVMKRQLFRP